WHPPPGDHRQVVNSPTVLPLLLHLCLSPTTAYYRQVIAATGDRKPVRIRHGPATVTGQREPALPGSQVTGPSRAYSEERGLRRRLHVYDGPCRPPSLSLPRVRRRRFV